MIYELKLTKAGMDLILAALAELPYKTSGALIDECMKQWTEQENAYNDAQKTKVLEEHKALEDKVKESLKK
jgi:hypothetical protein